MTQWSTGKGTWGETGGRILKISNIPQESISTSTQILLTINANLKMAAARLQMYHHHLVLRSWCDRDFKILNQYLDWCWRRLKWCYWRFPSNHAIRRVQILSLFFSMPLEHSSEQWKIDRIISRNPTTNASLVVRWRGKRCWSCF